MMVLTKVVWPLASRAVTLKKALPVSVVAGMFLSSPIAACRLRRASFSLASLILEPAAAETCTSSMLLREVVVETNSVLAPTGAVSSSAVSTGAVLVAAGVGVTGVGVTGVGAAGAAGAVVGVAGIAGTVWAEAAGKSSRAVRANLRIHVKYAPCGAKVAD